MGTYALQSRYGAALQRAQAPPTQRARGFTTVHPRPERTSTMVQHRETVNGGIGGVDLCEIDPNTEDANEYAERQVLMMNGNFIYRSALARVVADRWVNFGRVERQKSAGRQTQGVSGVEMSEDVNAPPPRGH